MLTEFVHKKLGDLQLNKTYLITATVKFNTVCGTAVLCDLKDAAHAYSVFLPKRYAEVYKATSVASLRPGVVGISVSGPITLSNGTTTYALYIDYCQTHGITDCWMRVNYTYLDYHLKKKKCAEASNSWVAWKRRHHMTGI